MKYLNNKVCDFKLLFNNFNPNNKKNIVSCAFFKLMSTPYKNFNVYIDGLEKLYDKVYNEYSEENFTIRLFIDNSIYNDNKLLERLKKMKKIELVLYSCVDYQIGDNSEYHLGLFGTIVRFFPMFDFENNDADIIIISDIDDYDYFEKSINNIKLVKSNIKSNTQLTLFKAGNITKNVLFTISSLYKNVPNPYAVASNFISFSKCDKDVLYNFLTQITKSNELLTKYQYKFSSNENLITGDIFIYGFDEYFLNINYTNFLVDTSKTLCVKFKWSVYGSLSWYLCKKDISQYQMNLINKLFKHIYKKINFNFVDDNNLWKKFKILDRIICKNNLFSKKVLYEYYSFFLSVENDDRYNFLFEKNIYSLIRDYNLFGIYDFEILTFTSSSSKYFNFIKKKMFSPEEISKLKNINKNGLLNRNDPKINKYDKINNVNCDIIFNNNISSNPLIKCSLFNLGGKIVFVKKEIIKLELLNSELINLSCDVVDSNEYIFYKKNILQIKKDNFDNYILLPIKKIKKCANDSDNSIYYIYTFNKLDYDYDYKFVSKLNFNEWLEYTIEICLTLYYLNHQLGIFHNNLYDNNELTNVMIKKNFSKKNIKVNTYEFEIIGDYPVIINFTSQSKNPSKKTLDFYTNNNNNGKNNDNDDNKYKFVSEIFIVYYYSFKSYFKFDDYWNKKYDTFYFEIEKKCTCLKEFDECILDNLFEIYKKKIIK